MSIFRTLIVLFLLLTGFRAGAVGLSCRDVFEGRSFLESTDTFTAAYLATHDPLSPFFQPTWPEDRRFDFAFRQTPTYRMHRDSGFSEVMNLRVENCRERGCSTPTVSHILGPDRPVTVRHSPGVSAEHGVISAFAAESLVGSVDFSISERGRVVIGTLTVEDGVRGQGISRRLLEGVIEHAGRARIFTTTLSMDNQRSFINAFRLSLTEASELYQPRLTLEERFEFAIRQTPAYKIRRRLGLGRIVEIDVRNCTLQNCRLPLVRFSVARDRAHAREPSSVSAPTCESIWTRRPQEPVALTRGQRMAIRDLANGDYVTSVQRLTVNGQDRVIVIVGELHVKNVADQQRFARMMERFNWHAVEGIDFQSYWFSRELTERVRYHGPGDKTQGSSIAAVTIKAELQQVEMSLATDIARNVESGEFTREQVLSLIDSGEFASTISESLRQSPNPGADQQAVLEALSQIRPAHVRAYVTAILDSQRRDPVSSSAPPPIAPATQPSRTSVVQLETGYRPSLRENIASALMVLGFRIRGERNNTLSDLLLRVGMPQFIAIERRNRFMVQTLRRHLESDPSVHVIVMTVGKDHVPGIVRELRARGARPEP